MRHLFTRTILFFTFCAVVSVHAQVDSVSPNNISLVVGGNVMKLPYYRNINLNSYNTKIKRAFVIIHGTDRNANDYYYTAMDAVGTVPNELDSTLIIAPQFLEAADVQAHSLGSDILFWSNSGGWKSASNSANSSPSVKISSFAVLDTILKRIVNNNPNLKIIVIGGHSAGGQVVNRYAASSTYITTVCQQNIPVRFIVSNPSSYLYLTNERRAGTSLNQFSVPSTTCNTYDDWKYGLNSLFTYPNIAGATLIKQQYGQREVVYLLGGADSVNSNDMDTSCEAKLQGRHRLERGTIFYNYIQHVYGSTIYQKQIKTIVPGIGHNHYGIFTSSQGINHILRMDTLGLCSVPTGEYELSSSKEISIYPIPCKDVLHIEYKNTEIPVAISVFTIVGECVKQHEGNIRQIDLSFLKCGVYFLKIQSKELNSIQKIVVVKD